MDIELRPLSNLGLCTSLAEVEQLGTSILRRQHAACDFRQLRRTLKMC